METVKKIKDTLTEDEFLNVLIMVEEGKLKVAVDFIVRKTDLPLKEAGLALKAIAKEELGKDIFKFYV